MKNYIKLGNKKIKISKKTAQELQKQFAQPDTYKLTVKYGQPIEDLLRKRNYDWTNSDITSESFPETRRGTKDLELQLIEFEEEKSIEEVLKHLEENKLRPANIDELLEFGAKYPEVQREYLVVALGSEYADRFGVRFVPYLFGGSGYRSVNLYWADHRWSSHYRFAAVSK